jgi:hypothetical protein
MCPYKVLACVNFQLPWELRAIKRSKYLSLWENCLSLSDSFAPQCALPPAQQQQRRLPGHRTSAPKATLPQLGHHCDGLCCCLQALLLLRRVGGRLGSRGKTLRCLWRPRRQRTRRFRGGAPRGERRRRRTIRHRRLALGPSFACPAASKDQMAY